MQGDAKSVEQELVDADQIAAMLFLSKRTVWRMVKSGLIPPPCLRYGRKIVRWRKADIQKIYNETKSG